MIADFELTKQTWVNITSGTSQETGQNLLVQNLGSDNIRVAVNSTQPSTAFYGLIVEPYDSCIAEPDVGESVWTYTGVASHDIHIEVI